MESYNILKKKHGVNGTLPEARQGQSSSTVWMPMMKSYFIDSQLPHNI
jgi:hypothetical protein